MASHAFVTLLTSDSYLSGAIVTAHSIRKVEKAKHVNFDLVCLITLDSIKVESIKALRNIYDFVISVDPIRSSHCQQELNLLGRQDLSSTVTKIHIWRLEQYKSIVYLDTDTLVLKPLSHLFNLTPPFSACPDIGWPDCFNSGLMVIKPSQVTFETLYEVFSICGSWDGGDQGLLNDFFSNDRQQSFKQQDPQERPGWNRLSFVYNVTPSAYYTYAPAYKRHGDKISMIHFIGKEKPWHLIDRRRYRNASLGPLSSSPSRNAINYDGLVDKWLDAYEEALGPIQPPGLTVSQAEFIVPKYNAEWDRVRPSAYQAPTLDQLKRLFNKDFQPTEPIFHKHFAEGREGGYYSLPSIVRLNVSQEKVQSRPSTEIQVGKNHQTITSPQTNSLVHHHDLSHFSAPPVRDSLQDSSRVNPSGNSSLRNHVWDASRCSPPTEGFQMNEPMIYHYESVWDRPLKEQSKSLFQPISTPQIPPVTHQDYSRFLSTIPQSEPIQPIFPWESEGRKKVERVFPHEETPGNQVPLKPNPAIQSHSDVHCDSQNLSSSPPSIHNLSLSQIYRNAWDDDPMICNWSHFNSFSRQNSRGWDHLKKAKATLARTPRLEIKSFIGDENCIGEVLDEGNKISNAEGGDLSFDHQSKQITSTYRMRRDSEASSGDADEEDGGEDDEPASEAGEPEMNEALVAETVRESHMGTDIPHHSQMKPELCYGNEPERPLLRPPMMRSLIIGVPLSKTESTAEQIKISSNNTQKKHHEPHVTEASLHNTNDSKNFGVDVSQVTGLSQKSVERRLGGLV